MERRDEAQETTDDRSRERLAINLYVLTTWEYWGDEDAWRVPWLEFVRTTVPSRFLDSLDKLTYDAWNAQLGDGRVEPVRPDPDKLKAALTRLAETPNGWETAVSLGASWELSFMELLAAAAMVAQQNGPPDDSAA